MLPDLKSLDSVSGSAASGFSPFVSVIVPIYNGETDLPDLLNCLQQQTYPSDRVEYLLVDNGSHDRTASLLQQAVQQTQAENLITLRALSETEIQSSYAARNTGIRAASGEILVFTDADCRPQPHWLHHLIQPFVNPEINLVAGEVRALPGSNWLEQYADRHDTLSQTHTLAHSFCPYGQTANLAIRKTVLQSVGLFRPYLTTGGDADLCWRILRSGNGQIQLAEQAVVLHRHRSTLKELRSQWRRYGCSNRYLHELHGVSLMRQLTTREAVYRCGRWLFKQIPLAILKTTDRNHGWSHLVDTVIDTPLELLCRQSRDRGQQQAHLPDAARQVAWFAPVAAGVPQEAVSEAAVEPHAHTSPMESNRRS